MNKTILKLMYGIGFTKDTVDHAFVKPSWDLGIIGFQESTKEVYVRKDFIENIWKEAQKELLEQLRIDFYEVHMINMNKYIDKKLKELE